jgi:hypothetical protein
MIISTKKFFHRRPELLSLGGQKNGYTLFPKRYFGSSQSMLEVIKGLTGYYCCSLALFQKSRTQVVFEE